MCLCVCDGKLNKKMCKNVFSQIRGNTQRGKLTKSFFSFLIFYNFKKWLKSGIKVIENGVFVGGYEGATYEGILFNS